MRVTPTRTRSSPPMPSQSTWSFIDFGRRGKDPKVEKEGAREGGDRGRGSYHTDVYSSNAYRAGNENGNGLEGAQPRSRSGSTGKSLGATERRQVSAGSGDAGAQEGTLFVGRQKPRSIVAEGDFVSEKSRRLTDPTGRWGREGKGSHKGKGSSVRFHDSSPTAVGNS